MNTSAAIAVEKPKEPLSASLERVLRLAARSLPGIQAHRQQAASLPAIATELRRLRTDFAHHGDAMEGIQSWLEQYEGRP